MTSGPSPSTATSSGSLFYQYIATVTANIALVCSGMHFGWPSPSLPLLLDEAAEIHVTDADGSWLAIMVSIGAACGALLASVVIDNIGRKLSILLLSPVYFASWLVIALGSSVTYFYIARFVVGLTDGIAYTVFPMYICEISDSKIRGVLGSTMQAAIVIGLLLINAIGLYLPIKETALISAAVPLLHFITFIWMPESPYFLIMKGKYDRATSSLKTLKQVSNVDEEISRLNTAIEKDKQASGNLLDLLTVESNRNAALVIFIIRFLQQMTGNYPIAFYCQTIFLEVGGAITSSVATIIYFSGQLVVVLISSILVDKTGRRPLLILSTIGSCIALVVEGTYFYLKTETTTDLSSISFLPLGALLLYLVMYSIGLTTIPTILLGEVFPTSIKAFALCIADIIFSISVAIASKYFQITKDSFGLYIPFFSFAIICVVLLLFIVFCVPETKGKTLEDIQLMFKGSLFVHKNRRKQIASKSSISE